MLRYLYHACVETNTGSWGCMHSLALAKGNSLGQVERVVIFSKLKISSLPARPVS